MAGSGRVPVKAAESTRPPFIAPTVNALRDLAAGARLWARTSGEAPIVKISDQEADYLASALDERDRLLRVRDALAELYEAVLAVTPVRVINAHPDSPEDARLLAALLAAEQAVGLDGEPSFNTCPGNHTWGQCDRDDCDFVGPLT